MIGEIAELATAILEWVTDPHRLPVLTVPEQCDRLHEAAMKAVDAKDFRAFDVLMAEFRRMRRTLV